MKVIKMVDIAKAAGVSQTTVSLALNEKAAKKYKISPDTVARIRKIADQMGYRPNQMGVSLATKRTNTIGVLIPNYGDTRSTGSIRDGLASVLEPDYRIIASLYLDGNIDESKALNTFLDFQVDGIIAQWSGNKDSHDVYKSVVQRYKKPMVLIQYPIDELKLPVVRADYFSAAYEATKSLLELGHKKILHVSHGTGGPFKTYCDYSFDGYRKAMTDYDCSSNIQIVKTEDFDIDESYYHYPKEYSKFIIDKLKGPWNDITALQVLGDPVAGAIVRNAPQMGLRIPEDVSIIGMGAFSFSAPGIFNFSTVDENHAGVGIKAAELLREILDGRDNHEAVYDVPVEVLHRATTIPCNR